jgi:hypothetical protein
MSNFVFVLDTNRKPLSPCKPGVARSLLNAGKAAVFRRFPFTIILHKEVEATPEPIELKLDPGSKTTGIALKQGNKIIVGAELTHRGHAIKASLDSRRSLRRGRRSRHTRYRQARFLNRTRPDGWLAPSLKHRVETTLTWFERFCKVAPIGSIVQELVRFDLQQRSNPEISGVEYQQGELQGYEVREYLLNKWDRKCAYCAKATGHGTRQMCRTDKYGFPSRYAPRLKFVQGFQTGDIVKAVVTTGKKVGEYVGRVAVRSVGSFNISTSQGLVQGINHKYCKSIQRKDGYSYGF